MKLYHDCPECPKCETPGATPAKFARGALHDEPSRNLYCPACGHRWEEGDEDVIAQAWFAAGAWKQAQEDGVL